MTSQEQVIDILKQYHNSPTGGHLGINRLYRKVKSMYTWQNMKQSISNSLCCDYAMRFYKIRNYRTYTR